MTNTSPSTSKTYWTVVADESRAIFYTQETRRGPLIEQHSMENAAARMKTGDLISDTGGRSFDSHGQGRHTMAKEKSEPKQHAATMFAKDIIGKVQKGLHDGSCRDFALIAPPRMLGSLRDAVAHAGIAEPFRTVDKDVVQQDANVIHKLMQAD